MPDLLWLGLAVTLSVSMFAWMFWHVYNSFEVARVIRSAYQKGEELHDRLTDLNLSLTLAARMAAATQQEHWLDEHRKLTARFDEAVDDGMALGLLGYDEKAVAEAADIRRRLTGLERRSFELARPESHDRAIALLSGPDHDALESAFSEAIHRFQENFRERTVTRLQQERNREVMSLGVAFATFAVSLGLWILLVHRLRRSRSALMREVDRHRRTEQKYRGLFEGVNDPVFIIDPVTLSLLDANESAARRLGYSKEELRALTLEDIAGPFEQDPNRQILDTLNASGSVVFEHRYRCKDGSIFPVEIGSRLVDYEGRRVYQSVARDLTERRLLEEEVRQAQKMEAVGHLAGGIAHDFSNLLTAVSGYVSLAERSLPPDHPARRSLERIGLATEQATGVTRSLLSFSRRSAVEKTPLELHSLVADSARLLRDMLPSSIRLITDESNDGAARVTGNRVELEQAVLNLALNARDAMPEGGTLTISVSVRQLPSQHVMGGELAARPEATITVTDTGVGIAPTVRGRIFEPLFTTKPQGAGTGLGLSVVHRIVTDHGGRLEVESEPGRGSSFSIVLPLLDRSPAITEPPPQSKARCGSGAVVLIAEDHRYVREMIATSLQNCGYEVIETADGEAFLEEYRLRRTDVDLLIIDVDLPKRGGLDCLSDIRKQGDDLPAIVITGITDADLEDRIGSQALLLRKPFPMAELCRLSTAVTKHRAEAAPRK